MVVGIVPQWDSKMGKVSVDRAYMDKVVKSGGIPVVLPFDYGRAMDALSLVDGVMFIGGVDVCPSKYGQDRQVQCGVGCMEQDDYEVSLCQAVVTETDISVLAVCRGIQVLNVAMVGLWCRISRRICQVLMMPG